jgi:formamidopyrimidine-DNA glycosylase
VLVGRRLVSVEQRRADLRFPLPDGFGDRLTGRVIKAIERSGKYLLMRLDDDCVWLAHLGMSGRFRIEVANATSETHDHLVFTTADGVRLSFHDPRRFGFMDLVATGGLAMHPMLARLGPDPLGDSFDGSWLAKRFAGRITPLKAAILDQAVVAGMGNIYASESLFHARISPERLAVTVTRAEAARLAAAIRAVFLEAIAAGGSSLRDHRQPSGELGFFQHRFAVYGRAGGACPGCRCTVAETGGIRRIVQAGRSTYFCARRQR